MIGRETTYTDWLPVAAIFARQQLPALDNLEMTERKSWQHLAESLGASVGDAVLGEAQRQQVPVHSQALNTHKQKLTTAAHARMLDGDFMQKSLLNENKTYRVFYFEIIR